MSPDLSVRAVAAHELMDDPHADQRMLEHTYRRFALINSVVSRPGLLYRRDIRPRARRGRVRILDVGSGGGDLCRMLAARLRRDGLPAHITALDADDRATRWASAHDAGAAVRYLCAHTADLVRVGETFDIVLSNHVLHHLGPDELQQLLSETRVLAGDGGLVVHGDIARSRFAYVLFAALTLPLAKNLLAGSFIRDDGLTSIRRSYTASELAAVAPSGWQVRTGIPSRIELRWGPADA
ncbi:MAG: methyltransferase domain-containing protein [Microbacterium sp.]|uniref:methyltransferase domain-containing protein n=1 Tax=Microbacterium sp. TaxID=51671 RepID=UPI001DD97656|nr:methyltransferase domain-containing protein [Microbacterium sp.]MBW8763059.1 methyltransferase domain-containing protein [Microbacterium sp.]